MAHHYEGYGRQEPTVLISGGFDPIHKGHVRLIQEAAKYGKVIVVANSDNWLNRKKGYVFMTWEERAEILRSIKGVWKVERVNDSDDTVCEALRRLKPDCFANGGDRKSDNVPELDICKELGITPLWNIGGEKAQSSSQLTNKLLLHDPSNQKPAC